VHFLVRKRSCKNYSNRNKIKPDANSSYFMSSSKGRGAEEEEDIEAANRLGMDKSRASTPRQLVHCLQEPTGHLAVPPQDKTCSLPH